MRHLKAQCHFSLMSMTLLILSFLKKVWKIYFQSRFAKLVTIRFSRLFEKNENM